MRIGFVFFAFFVVHVRDRDMHMRKVMLGYFAAGLLIVGVSAMLSATTAAAE